MKKTAYRRRKIMSRDEAHAVLEPHIDDLITNLDRSWSWTQDILDEDPERRVVFDGSIEASMVYLRFRHLTMSHFDDVDGAKATTHGRHMSVAFEQGLRLRFKKLDQRLRSGNVRTNRQREIYHQMEIEGITSPTDVTFGYVTTPAGDGMSGVYVTCPVGWRENAWMIAVRDPGLEGGLSLFGKDDNGPSDDEVIVVPKTAASKQKNKGA